MTDKVQKIKDWISKEQDGLMDAQGNFEYPEHEGAYHILCNLDTYIDSLQKEPVSIDFEQELYKAFGQVKDFTLGMRIAKWFYDMGKNSQEHVSEDLGEYINELSKQFPEVSFAKLSRIAVRVAKWQITKLMKDATEVTVHIDAGGYPYTPEIELYDYDKDVPLAKEGDKYKVVLIKED